jgi:tRNA A-37 threonylcarbamoyl transferase component Bud32
MGNNIYKNYWKLINPGGLRDDRKLYTCVEVFYKAIKKLGAEKVYIFQNPKYLAKGDHHKKRTIMYEEAGFELLSNYLIKKRYDLVFLYKKGKMFRVVKPEHCITLDRGEESQTEYEISKDAFEKARASPRVYDFILTNLMYVRSNIYIFEEEFLNPARGWGEIYNPEVMKKVMKRKTTTCKLVGQILAHLHSAGILHNDDPGAHAFINRNTMANRKRSLEEKIRIIDYGNSERTTDERKFAEELRKIIRYYERLKLGVACGQIKIAYDKTRKLLKEGN